MHKRLSLKKNFSWALFGNTVFQACRWLMLIVLAKLTTVDEVGRYALALAVCTPITILAALQLRAVQVTDARNEYHFGHYLALRIVMTLAAVLVIVCIAIFSDYSVYDASLIIAIGIGQGILLFREVFLSFMQKNERMDYVATSQIIIGVLSLTTLATLIWLTGSVLAGVIGVVTVRLFTLLFWDLGATGRFVAKILKESSWRYFVPRWEWKNLIKLAWLALPLGITTFMVSLNSNVPRYLIEKFLTRDALGYFAALASLPLAGNIIIGAAGSVASPRLARYYVESPRAYLKLLIKLILVAVVLGVSGFMLAWLFGKPILTFVFKPEYAAYHMLLLLLMIRVSLAYISSFLGVGITSARRFRIQLVLVGSVLIATTIGCWMLIPRYGLNGAAFGVMIGSVVNVIGNLLVVWHCLHLKKEPAKERTFDVSALKK
ncbi:MAG: oligosaccharide flippase family protein [Planctomycetota bacterium]|jgi:O-antigen/teichoic acid export membrane protein